MAIGVSWATSLALCLIAIPTYANWTHMEEEGWRWISMFYSDFYTKIFIPLSCLTASAILGLYVAILVLLKKQSKKLEIKTAVAPSGDSASDSKRQENPTRLFMLSENMQPESPSNPSLFPSKIEQLDSNFCVSNQSSSNPEVIVSSDSNQPRDCMATNGGVLRLQSASNEFARLREEDTSTLSRTAEISGHDKTKFLSNVRGWQSTRHGSIDNRGSLSVANHGGVGPYPVTFQKIVVASGSPTKPRLSFRNNSIAVSRPRLVVNSAGLDHVGGVPDMSGVGVSALRRASNMFGDISAISNALRERGKRGVEGRTAKLSAIAVAAFLSCWLPFSVIVSYQRHNGKFGSVQTGLFLFGLTLSFLGSAVNQLVYCIVNRQLRQEFINLCSEILSKLRKCS